jgi:hypothetical protein
VTSKALFQFEDNCDSPATAKAHNAKVAAEVKFGGAKGPKLANSNGSRNTRRAMNAFGVPCPTC